MAHRDVRDQNTELLAFLDDLKLKGFRVRLTLAYDYPDIEGNCIRLNIGTPLPLTLGF